MTSPLFTRAAIAPIRATSEAGMLDTAKRWVSVTTRYPNGEESTALVLETTGFPCRLSAVGAELAQLAAAQGVKAQWSFTCPLPYDVAIGQQIQVTGETDDTEWTREIVITMDKGLTGRVHRHCAAVDLELNQ